MGAFRPNLKIPEEFNVYWEHIKLLAESPKNYDDLDKGDLEIISLMIGAQINLDFEVNFVQSYTSSICGYNEKTVMDKLNIYDCKPGKIVNGSFYGFRLSKTDTPLFFPGFGVTKNGVLLFPEFYLMGDKQQREEYLEACEKSEKSFYFSKPIVLSPVRPVSLSVLSNAMYSYCFKTDTVPSRFYELLNAARMEIGPEHFGGLYELVAPE